MNRICLKRKQAQRKASICTLADPICSENGDLDKSDTLSQISNSPAVSKAVAQESQNHRLFQQFKIQYDQLRHAYQSQRISYDELLQQKKRLQIQILNNNPEFYDKEIKRLRGEVEKLQEQNEDYKHKFIVAQNSKKQLQATVKVRNEELKRSIQLIEKEKVTNVELKHQLNQKQKLFQRITSQMQKSGNVLSQSFEDANTRIQKLQFNLKNKSNDMEALQRNYDHLAKKLNQTEKTLKANKQIFDQTNFKKSQIIDQLQTKLRNLNRSSRDTIQGLENKIEQIKNQRKTENLLIDQQIEVKRNFKQQRVNQLQIVRLEQLNKQARIQLQNKVKLVKSLQQKLLGTISIEEYQELESKIKQLETEKDSLCKNYEQKILKIERQLANEKLNQFRNPAEEQGVTNNFQQLLRVQLEQNAKVKKQLAFKLDQVYNLKSDVDDLKCKLRANQDQISILNKKIKSQQKNHKIEADVTSQNLKNEIDSLKRKLDMMQIKIDQKTKQIKQKQNFIMSTIIGRSRQEDVPLIIAEIQRIFEADYVTRLSAALQKIQELERK